MPSLALLAPVALPLTAGAVTKLNQELMVGSGGGHQQAHAVLVGGETKINVKDAAGERQITRAGVVLLSIETSAGTLAIRVE